MYVHYIRAIHEYTTLVSCSDKSLSRVLGNLEIAMCPRKDPPALTFGSVYHCGVVRHSFGGEGGRKVPHSNVTAKKRNETDGVRVEVAGPEHA